MGLSFNDKQTTTLLAALGLGDDVTDADLTLDVIKDVASGVSALQQPSAIVAAAEKAGLEVLDADTAKALRLDAAEGRRIRAEVEKQKVLDTVNDAVRKGKITPARADHWVNLITHDPGMADVLKNTPDGTAMPVNQIGHGVANEDTTAPNHEGWFYD